MTFGKPNLSTDPVRCINCGEKYPEKHVELVYAGRTDDGDFWNDRCPECGVMNGMRAEYAELSDKEFKSEQHKQARTRRETIKHQQREKL